MDSMYRHQPFADATKQIRLLRFHSRYDNRNNISLQLTTYDLDATPPYNAISYTWGNESQFRVFDLDDTPPFNTISHLWGNESQRKVLVNGLQFPVRENCRYALYQAQLHYPFEHVWIDSICIDQTNNTEKNHQVQLMWSIYCKASLVLACVGPHENGSEYLARYSDKVQETWTQWYSKRHSESPASPSDDWDEYSHEKEDRLRRSSLLVGSPPTPYWSDSLVHALEEKEFRDLLSVYEAFAQRQYWNRLWIAQEITAGCQPVRGSQRLRILCGCNNLHRGILDLLPSLMWRHRKGSPLDKDRAILDRLPSFLGRLWQSREHIEINHVEDLNNLRDATIRVGDLSLRDALDVFKDFRCRDPRDRIYGILGLVDWETVEVPPIVPNYNISNFQLARQLCPYLGMDEISDILIVMRVECTHPEMQELIRRRVASTMDGLNAAPCEELTSILDVQYVKTWIIEDNMLGPLGQDSSDQLGLERLWKHELFPGIAGNRIGEHAANQEEHQHALPKCILKDGEVAYLVCGATNPGDTLVNFDPLPNSPGGPMDGLSLIVRQEHGEQYSVVGQGVFNVLNEDNLDDRHLQPTHAATSVPFLGLPNLCHMKLRLTKDDALVLMGQDFKLQSYHPGWSAPARLTHEQWKFANLTRLFLNPVTRPRNAMTCVPTPLRSST